MSVLKKIGFLTLGNGINILVNLLFLPYMSRALSYTEYGSYGQVLLIITAVATIVTFGLPQIINIHLSDRSNRKNKVLVNNLSGAFLISFVGFTLLQIFAGFFADFFNNENLSILIRIYAFSVFLNVPYLSINSYLIFIGKVKTSVYLTIFPNVLKVILVVISIQYFSSLKLALIAIILASLVQLLMGLYSVKTDLNFKPSKSEMFNQLKGGLPLGMTNIISMIILYMDSIMVSRFLGIKAYAIYRNGAIEVPFIATIYVSIAAVVMPEVAKLWKDNKIDQLFVLKKKVVMDTVYLVYPIIIFALYNSDILLTLYLGDRYAGSAIIFSVFNVIMLLRVNDNTDILISANKSKTILMYYSVAAILNFILNYLLILNFGAIGAAMSTLFTLALLVFLQLRKSLKISNKKVSHLIDLKETALVFLTSLVYIVFLDFLLDRLIDYHILKLLLLSLSYFAGIIFIFTKMKFYSLKKYSILFKKNL